MTVTINGSTGISGIDGTAATPSMQGADTNTGMFYGTDIVGISTGGTERMRVNASGNVGIGTTDNYRLAVVGGATQLSGSTEAAAGLRIQSIGGVAHLSGINSDNNAFNPIALYTGNTESISMDTSGVVTGTAGNLMLISGTSVASTSGTGIDFTDIPSWVKRVTVIFRGVSTTGTSPPQIQLGTAGGIVSSGYVCGNSLVAQAVLSVNFTAAFGIGVNTSNWLASHLASGQVIFSLIDSNTWSGSGAITVSGISSTYFTTGSVALGAVLDRVRITTAGGVQTFDAGTINIMYE
jgi:hypothetical protein